MEVKASFSHVTPHIFDGENYRLLDVKIKTYLESLDLWEALKEDYDVPPLPNNPTITHIKSHKERKIKKSKSKAYLFVVVSTTIFIKIMSLKSAKQSKAKDVSDYL